MIKLVMAVLGMGKRFRLAMAGLLVFLLGLLFVCSGQSFATEPSGDYSGWIINRDKNPEIGQTLNSNGDVVQEVEDFWQRTRIRARTVEFQGEVRMASFSAVAPRSGWNLAVPTATVTSDRLKIRIYNPASNTQWANIGLSTGNVGSLTMPTTNQYIATIKPHESFEIECSTGIHPVFIATGTVINEPLQTSSYK